MKINPGKLVIRDSWDDGPLRALIARYAQRNMQRVTVQLRTAERSERGCCGLFYSPSRFLVCLSIPEGEQNQAPYTGCWAQTFIGGVQHGQSKPTKNGRTFPSVLPSCKVRSYRASLPGARQVSQYPERHGEDSRQPRQHLF